jgi:uncharacterized membrane protein
MTMLPTRIGDHPIHAMLVPFPIALWIFSFICDSIYIVGWGGQSWADIAFYTMCGGIVGALLAAIFGLGDFLSLSEPKVARIATFHMILNLVVVVLFSVNAFLRISTTSVNFGLFLLSALGVALLAISGWLGGELVYVHGVAVAKNRNLQGKQRINVA